MTVLGIDFGERRIGISLGKKRVASPLTTIVYKNQEEAVGRIAELCRLHKANLVVLGLPLNREGGVGFAGRKVKAFGSKLSERLSNLKIVYFDETLSTADALKGMRKLGLGKKKCKEKKDTFAAAVLLRRYLNAQR